VGKHRGNWARITSERRDNIGKGGNFGDLERLK
jgi:hypothetical protein